MKFNTPGFVSAKKALLRALALTGASSLVGSGAFGAEITKANNSDSMNLTTSWNGGVIPGVSDVAIWGPGLDNGTSAALGANTSWAGLKVSGNPSSIRLGLSSDATSAFTLTLGAAGLNLSAATAGSSVSIDGPKLAFLSGVQQMWSVPDGITAETFGTLTANNGALVKFDLGVTGNGAVLLAGVTTANALIGGYAIVGDDFAAVNSDNYVKPGASLGIYQANPAPDATTVSPVPVLPVSGSLMDFSATTTSDGSLPLHGMSAPNTSWFMQGFRFNVPNARTDLNQWTINMGNSANSARTITPSAGIIVGSGVGTDNVVFSGTGTLRVPNATGTNRITLVQNNPQGDLIFTNGGGFGAQTAATATIVKTGVGRVIIAAPVFANNGLYIHGGTVQFGNGGVAGAPGTGAIFNNGALVFDRSDAISVGGIISGTGSLTKNSAGVLTLNGANTYTGATTINGGSIVLGSATSLGVTPSIILNGGGLTYGTGITTDVSSVPVSLPAGTNTINTNGNNVAFAQSIGQAGSGSLVKAGTGILNLAAANTYTGGTSVTGGTLAVTNTTGSATGSGAVSLASGSALAGTGTVSGAVTANAGSLIVPGNNGVGTLTLGGLNLAANTLQDFEFTSTSVYDRVVTTASNGLTVNGGKIHLYAAGSTNPWNTPGTYNLFQYSGTLQGVGTSALSILNPQAGYAYTFGTNGTFLTLLIELDAILSQWIGSGSGSWGASGNWGVNGVPTTGYTAQFTTNLAAPATVTLDGSRTVNGMVFTSSNAYTIAQGTGGTLTLDKGAKTAAVNITQGNHVISSPVAFASAVAVSTDASTSLTLSGTVSGVGTLAKTGLGLLDLTGHNPSWSGSINATVGTLGFAFSDSLGTGPLTLNGAILRYDTGNTADISSRVITFGQDGATIDTNGNDVILANAIGNGGSGSFTKTGAGILALDGANTYTGGTIVAGGTLLIDDNAQLGDTTSPLTLNGGTFAAGASFNLQLAGTTPVNRSVVVGAASPTGSTFLVSSGQTLGVPGVISGTGLLVKDGAGTLNLTNVNSTKSGGVTLRDGTLRFGTDMSFGTGTAGFLGAGTLTLEGGTITSANTAENTLTINNPIAVPAGKTASIVTPNRFAITQPVSGAGTLNMSVNTTVTRADFSTDFTGFTGRLNLTGTGAIRLLNNGGGFNTAGLLNAYVDLGSGLTFVAATNSGGNAFQIGALSGAGTLSNSNGGISNYQIGARNDSTTFSGSFVSGTAVNSVTKVGTGTLTLNGAALHVGLTTVNAGTLLIDSTLPVSTAAAPTLPLRTVTVAAAGTFGGHGVITPDTVVNGALRPDSTGLNGGQLTFGGVLELAATSTTTFDFGGAVFTGVKSTLASGVTYGGALKINFPSVVGTVFNGSYTLFELNGAPLGAFTGASITTPSSANLVLNNNSGTWEGSDASGSFSFNSATGVLTVTGAASALTPGVSTLSATAGNGKVDLSWTAASDANTYTVKRATVAGGPYTNVIAGLAATTHSDTGVINGTTYYYVVQAKNTASGLSGINSNEVSAIPVAAPTHTALEQWRFDEFGVYADDGTVLAGNTEDFDGDGLVNILEYALGTDPTVANASPVVVGRTGNNLTLTYPRRAVADPALAYSVLGSSDLTTAFTAGAGATNTVGTTSTYTDNVDLSVAGTRRFLRLSVTYTAP